MTTDYKELAKIWFKHFGDLHWEIEPPEQVFVEYSKEMVSYIIKEMELWKNLK